MCEDIGKILKGVEEKFECIWFEILGNTRKKKILCNEAEKASRNDDRWQTEIFPCG